MDKFMKLLDTTKIDTQGKFYIPKKIVKHLRIRPEDNYRISIGKNSILLTKIEED